MPLAHFPKRSVTDGRAAIRLTLTNEEVERIAQAAARDRAHVRFRVLRAEDVNPEETDDHAPARRS